MIYSANSNDATNVNTDSKELTICRKTDGTPRTTYHSTEEANVSVLLAKQYGQKLFSYKCRICEGIHIRPIGTPAPPKACTQCKKNGYESVSDATFVAKRRYRKDGISLAVYPCPCSDEYHLTKG